MEKILVEEMSSEIETKIKEIKKENGILKFVTVFFENSNFLITNYKPLTNGVHLILELADQTQLHVERANCGYVGEGPSTTISILKLFGLDERKLRKLIFCNDAVRFEVLKGQIIQRTVDTTFIFYPPIREAGQNKSLYSKIRKDRNLTVDLENEKVMVYNPQRTCWNGFLNLLNYMEDIKFEYYIGSNSRLEGGLYIGERFQQLLYIEKGCPDIRGAEHVNLVLSGSNFRVVCLIDRKDEYPVIESVYLSLTGTRLFEHMQYGVTHARVWKILLKVLRQQQQEIYNTVKIKKIVENSLVEK